MKKNPKTQKLLGRKPTIIRNLAGDGEVSQHIPQNSVTVLVNHCPLFQCQSFCIPALGDSQAVNDAKRRG